MSWDGAWGHRVSVALRSPIPIFMTGDLCTDLQSILLRYVLVLYRHETHMRRGLVVETDTKMPSTFVHSIEKNMIHPQSVRQLYILLESLVGNMNMMCVGFLNSLN